MRYSVYGTVYNSVNTIENSIKSAFSSSYDLVITDSFSNDGTYEKLKKIRQEYNIDLYRLKCSRGNGKDYSLRKCKENSRTVWIDLDVIYNRYFHKLLLSDTDKLLTIGAQLTFFGKKRH